MPTTTPTPATSLRTMYRSYVGARGSAPATAAAAAADEVAVAEDVVVVVVLTTVTGNEP